MALALRLGHNGLLLYSAQAGSGMGGAIVAVRGGGANGNGLEAPRQQDGAGVDAQAGSSALGRCQLAAW
jgi:hypothetical protein